MKLGIMQPYFFPYLGYLDLINCTDEWIIFDTVQYIKKGWMNRNRILCPNKEYSFIIVPIKKQNRSTLIKDTKISTQINWRQKIISQLDHYKITAPYFINTKDLVLDCLSYQGDSLNELNVYILEKLCKYLQINFKYSYFSKMNMDLEIHSSGDWALEISKKMKASEYINPPGGKDLFNINDFAQAGIKLKIKDIAPLKYETPGYNFIPRLSIIDVLMWNTISQVKDYLSQHYV